jgi:hypothetical protein
MIKIRAASGPRSEPMTGTMAWTEKARTAAGPGSGVTQPDDFASKTNLNQ